MILRNTAGEVTKEMCSWSAKRGRRTQASSMTSQRQATRTRLRRKEIYHVCNQSNWLHRFALHTPAATGRFPGRAQSHNRTVGIVDRRGRRAFALLQSCQRTLVAPRARGGTEETPLEGGGTGSDEDELSRWANMSLGEKIRAQYLEARGLSEGDLAAMPPDAVSYTHLTLPTKRIV